MITTTSYVPVPPRRPLMFQGLRVPPIAHGGFRENWPPRPRPAADDRRDRVGLAGALLTASAERDEARAEVQRLRELLYLTDRVAAWWQMTASEGR